jgi:hypothetical protein
MTRPPFEPPREIDVAVVTSQLGRPARGAIGIAARCLCGNPTVVATAPHLDDGSPFPTLYYLTHPAATSAVSTLEATGVMAELSALLADEHGEPTPLGTQYRAAHDSYLADRESIEAVDEITGYSAGGMPDRIKCLHALVAHALAAGPGVNPIGDLALARADWTPDRCECAQPGPGASE